MPAQVTREESHWPCARERVGARWLVCALALLPLGSGLRAQTNGALVTRHGAQVAGTIEGSLQVVGEGEVALAKGASVSGDLVLPAEKPERSFKADGSPAGVGNGKLSSKTKVDNRAGDQAVRGQIRAVERYELPSVLAPTKPVKSAKLEIGTMKVSPAELMAAGNLTVKMKDGGEGIMLPPGAYGSCVIENGTVFLGLAGSDQPVRYEFRSLVVQRGGTLRVAGPVVVTLANGDVWQGSLGDSAMPFWLDVRVASGEVTLASGCSFYGFLSAPASTVTVESRAALSGGLLGDTLVVNAGGKVALVDPDWSDSRAGGREPTFSHRALRVQRGLVGLKQSMRRAYSPAVSYPEDVPYIMLVENPRAPDQPVAFEKHMALLQSFIALFADAGFARAGIVFVDQDPGKDGRPSTVRNVFLYRSDFESLAKEVGKKAVLRDNIVALYASQELIAQFAERCLAAGAVAGAR